MDRSISASKTSDDTLEEFLFSRVENFFIGESLCYDHLLRTRILGVVGLGMHRSQRVFLV